MSDSYKKTHHLMGYFIQATISLLGLRLQNPSSQVTRNR